MKHSRRVLVLFASAAGAWGGLARARPDAKSAGPGAAAQGAREAAIIRGPPRIAPLPQNEIPAGVREQMSRLRAGLGLPPSQAPVSDFNAIMAKSPELMRAHLELANFLFRGNLPVRDRELAVLRVGWLAQAPYEWGEHVKIAKRLGNATEAEILRVRQGSSAPGWSDHERAILRGVEELMSNAMISDQTWAVLARTWNDAQLLEFPILVGQYLGVAFLQNSVRVPLEKGNPGLTAQ